MRGRTPNIANINTPAGSAIGLVCGWAEIAMQLIVCIPFGERSNYLKCHLHKIESVEAQITFAGLVEVPK